MHRLWIAGLAIVVLGIAAVSAVVATTPALAWRAKIVVMHSRGQIDGLGLLRMLRWLSPDSPVYLEELATTGNPYQTIHNPLGSEEDAAAGAQRYEASCGKCHGPEAVGAAGPALDRRPLEHGDSDWALFRVIAEGVPGTEMPAHDFEDHALWEVVAYLRSVQSRSDEKLDAAIPRIEPVTNDRLLRGGDEPHNWIHYSATYDGKRYSPLDQITPENASRVSVKWVHQFDNDQKIVEVTPIVNGDVMYVTEPPNDVHALDVATGETLWSHVHPVSGDLRLCCGQVNRGVAVHGKRVFTGTLDAKLVALDAETGAVLWTATLADHRMGYSVTSAPLVVKDRVIVGVGGGDLGIRGFLDAYDVETGERVWRFWVIPGPGEPGHETWAGDSWQRGGGGTWLTGTYDPDLDLLYWPVGNPSPLYQGEVREGDNLYTASVLALDPDDGSLRWHFQFTPHDEHDWAANQVPILVDRPWRGRDRKLLMTANRNGFFYVLDRETGEFLHASAYCKQNWAERIDENGRPVPDPRAAVPAVEGTVTWPGPIGGANWQSPTFSPRTGLFYVPVLEMGQVVFKHPAPQEYEPGKVWLGGGHKFIPGAEHLQTFVRAIDPETGEIVWEHENPKRPAWWKTSGLVATGGDIVFGGDDRRFYILDARSGDELYALSVGGRINAAPISYAVDGEQRLTLAAGRSLITLGLPGP